MRYVTKNTCRITFLDSFKNVYAKNRFLLDFSPEHIKARELVNAWSYEKIIVFLN